MFGERKSCRHWTGQSVRMPDLPVTVSSIGFNGLGPAEPSRTYFPSEIKSLRMRV